MINKLSIGSSALRRAGRQLTAMLVLIYKALTKVRLDTDKRHTEKTIKDIHSDYWKALAIISDNSRRGHKTGTHQQIIPGKVP